MPLGNNAEILQIAATDGSDEFNAYVLPQHGISPAATAVNKLTFLHGTLFYNGRPVAAVSLPQALLTGCSQRLHVFFWLIMPNPLMPSTW